MGLVHQGAVADLDLQEGLVEGFVLQVGSVRSLDHQVGSTMVQRATSHQESTAKVREGSTSC